MKHLVLMREKLTKKVEGRALRNVWFLCARHWNTLYEWMESYLHINIIKPKDSCSIYPISGEPYEIGC